MPRKLIGGLIQAAAPITDPSVPIAKIRRAAIDAHIPLIEDAVCPSQNPWNIGRFYGSSYFVDPRGNVIAMGSEDKAELVVAEQLP